MIISNNLLQHGSHIILFFLTFFLATTIRSSEFLIFWFCFFVIILFIEGINIKKDVFSKVYLSTLCLWFSSLVLYRFFIGPNIISSPFYLIVFTGYIAGFMYILYLLFLLIIYFLKKLKIKEKNDKII